MRRFFFVQCYILVGLCHLSAQDTLQHEVPDRRNSAAQKQKPYVILISADGFRYDFAVKYKATNLLRLAGKGVMAAYMQPSFPSLTFPNHYSIITGLYPSHHGLTDNEFYDRNSGVRYSMGNKKQVADASWYGGTPLWVLAEQQQMLTASFYWVASETPIKGMQPTYYYFYNEKIAMQQRIAEVKRWLELPEDKRPHFITFYFPQVDHEAHNHGPDSKEARDAVHFVDESVGKLTAMVDSLKLPVNFIFVADHGMTKVDNKYAIFLPKAIQDSARFEVPYRYVTSSTSVLQVYVRDKGEIITVYNTLKKEATNYDVYLAENMPQRWHYGKVDDRYNRIGDIILVARPPALFNVGTKLNTNMGKHGYDPALPNMRAVFYAWGPAFKKIKIGGFENVNVYPLIAKILGLEYSFEIDGKLEVLEPVLNKLAN